MDENDGHFKRLYEIVGNTLLTRSDSTKGKHETFYWHTLRYYMLPMIEDTYKTLGIRIFTMQGFECRNKETKMSYQRCCNNNLGDTMSAQLKKMWSHFEYDNDSNDDDINNM